MTIAGIGIRVDKVRLPLRAKNFTQKCSADPRRSDKEGRGREGGGGCLDPPLKCDARAFRVFVLLIKLVLLFWIFSFPLPSWLINLVRSASPLNNS